MSRRTNGNRGALPGLMATAMFLAGAMNACCCGEDCEVTVDGGTGGQDASAGQDARDDEDAGPADTELSPPVPEFECEEGWVLMADGTGCVLQATLMVHGIVTDDTTGLPLQGIDVVLYPDGATTVQTDANGYFAFRDVVPASHDLILTYTHPAYLFATGTFSVVLAATEQPLVGMLLIDASMSLDPQPGVTRVAGTVYAGDAPASGARVVLYDSNAGYDRYTALAGTDGRFAFATVVHSNYSLRVRPFDADGDQVNDFVYFNQNLGNIETTANNLSNLVISLTPVSKQLLFVNLIGAALPMNVSAATTTNLRLANPAGNLILHFGSEVDVDTAVFLLLPWETGGGTGEPIPVTAVWSLGDTVVTLDPSRDLSPDADTDTQYELRILSLHWADGQVAIAEASPLFMALRFDVTTAAGPLTSPVPVLYVGNKRDTYQETTRVACDARVCWLYDASSYYFQGWADPTSGAAIAPAFNAASGLQLAWPAVDGASTYRVYARQRNDNSTSTGFDNWYLVNATLASAATPTEPTLDPTVYATGVMASVGGARNDWNDFNLTGGGPLAFDNELDLAVTVLDANGFESPITPALALTLRDDTASGLAGAVLDFNGAGLHAATTEYGSSRIAKVFALGFNELMDTAVAPELSALGGNITSMGTPLAASWDPTAVLTPENASALVVLGPVELRVRGACTPVTCPAEVNALEPARSDAALCVRDPSLFSTGQVFFTSAAGNALMHAALTLDSVDQAHQLIRFTTPVTSTIPNGAFACAAQGVAGDVAVLRAAAAGGDQLLDLDDASLFYSGEDLVIYDTNGDDFSIATVAALTTAAVDRLTLGGVLAAGAYDQDTTVVLRRPVNAEVGLRQVAQPSLRLDATAGAGTTTLIFSAGLAATTIMQGDLVLVDLDGVINTVGDRAFGVVTEVAMIPDDALTVGDQSDYHLVLGLPPSGMPGLTNGTLVVAGRALVLGLGDSIRISNGDPASATPVRDTSGNVGLNPFRDQFSPCAGTPGCLNNLFFF